MKPGPAILFSECTSLTQLVRSRRHPRSRRIDPDGGFMPGKPLRVLLVLQDPDSQRRIAVRLLGECGVSEIHQAASGDEAVKAERGLRSEVSHQLDLAGRRRDLSQLEASRGAFLSAA
jgi:hypothetical protein